VTTSPCAPTRDGSGSACAEVCTAPFTQASELAGGIGACFGLAARGSESATVAIFWQPW